VTTKIRAGVGFGDNYGDNPFPFFKNFKVGGKNDVRGFKEGSIGKKTLDSNSGDWVTYGGDKMINFSVETFFPVPFMKQADNYRLSIFLDGGSSFEGSINTSDIRYSTGIGALWMSPFGPLNVSLAVPLNDEYNDQTETFQFGMGSSF
jgi:outer membrane protein insertion porin family